MSKVELRKPAEKLPASQPETQKHKTYTLNTELPTSKAKMLDGYPKKVQCNPFTVKDIKTLVYAPTDELYYETLAKTIDNLSDVDVLGLCAIDFEALIHFMRVNICGAEVSYVVTCKDCHEAIPVLVDLREMKIGRVEFEEGKVVDGVTLALPRVKGRMEYEKLSDLTPVDRWALYIVEGDTVEDKIEIFNQQSPDFMKELSSYIASLNEDAGVDSKWKIKCPKCGDTEELEIPFRSQFFLPEYPTRDTEQDG